MKAHIIIIRGTDPLGILKNVLATRLDKLTYQEIDYATLEKAWNSSVKSALVTVCSNYMVETNTDVEVLLRFIQSFQKKSGNKFYAPRPNSYIAVMKPVIHGTDLQNLYSTLIQKKVYDFVHSLAMNLPKHAKKRLIQLKHKLNIKYQQLRFKGVISEQSFKPTVAIPDALAGLAGPWIDWRDEEALEHDLIQRNHLYFPHPTSMHVAVLNTCNLKCVMCPYHSPVYKGGHTSDYFDEEKSLSLATFERLADYAGKRKISLQFGQIEETLLHPNIFDFIRIAKRKGVPSIHLTTNGTILSEAKAVSLAESGVDSVMFSIDSVNPVIYKKIRGASLNKLERNIEYFLPLAKKHGIHVVCSFIRQEPAISQQDAFLEKWKSKGVDGVTFYVLSDHDQRTGEFIRTEQFREDDERYPCASPWVQTAIMPDGSVGLCCKTMTDIGWNITSVGNINTQDFDEIWSSAKYRTVRQELLRNKFEEFTTCKRCPIWSATTNLTEYGDDYIRSFNETMETIIFVK